ncbi:MAG: 3'(2'),5'-bisphosphate nucleotidase CysQ [Alphaproteobacteria bacterium]|nr:3'(2'),5'-bisphosphate nucleotidase CysQ [Alphaproteobacteria bacterium]
MNIDLLALEAVALAEQAGELICEIYKENPQVFEKKDGSPVTQADRQSHFFLKVHLEQLSPHIPVISEEDESSWTLKSPLYWLVDPLDGTKGFIAKTGEFCINIALMKDNHPILGIIHIPLTHETFYGYGGKAVRHHKGNTSRLHTRPLSAQGMTLLLGGYGKKHKEQEDFFLKAYPIARIERVRSAIKFALIASGKADLYIRFEACSEWDTAAGQALVEAAGGIMTNLDGSPFLYGKPGLLNQEFAVFGKKP